MQRKHLGTMTHTFSAVREQLVTKQNCASSPTCQGLSNSILPSSLMVEGVEMPFFLRVRDKAGNSSTD
ncbi:hypothetical protein O9992_08575 [Vibrio lentus]|nr:hypothetical protein [Vibrio lentus]